ncbi:MAG: response regulator [Acidobacteriota bacterium]
MIRTVIVDDESPSRDILREFLSGDEEFEIAAECVNGFEAVKAVAEQDPDLLLLDVQMPKLDGFEVLALLDRSPVVVFVTAHDEFALRAFDVHALDYLLKPFSEERFRQMLDRVREKVRRGERAPVSAMSSALRARPLQRIVIRHDDGEIQVVPVGRVDYVEASDDAIVIVTGGARLRKQQAIGELASELDPTRFVRIHRSFLLNIERIEKLALYARDSRVAILRDGTKLPVSRSGYATLKELL